MSDQPGTYEEWRVTGEPGGSYPSYDFTWSQLRNPHLGDPETAARGFLQMINDHHADAISAPWDDGPYLSHRTVIVGEWVGA